MQSKRYYIRSSGWQGTEDKEVVVVDSGKVRCGLAEMGVVFKKSKIKSCIPHDFEKNAWLGPVKGS